jgi:drug/metabolite transporter (DMT)-like permease
VSLPRLVLLGLLAAAMFSTNFVLNRAISLSGGNWVWSAALRYIDTALLLGFWLFFTRGAKYFAAMLALFRRKIKFFLLGGGIGYGLFYACLCYAANHAPAWITAATFQLTILASPLVLRGFGRKVPVHGVAFLLLIFAGVIIINAQRILAGISFAQVLAGVLPTAIAAFAYPLGNQLLSEAKHTGDSEIIFSDAIACVFLMTLGALPVFLALVLAIRPPPPNLHQLENTAIIALFAGCLATTLFLHARNLSGDPYRIAAVDATQAGEVAFALLGEMMVIGTPALGLLSWTGLAAVLAGLLGFTLWRPAAR